MDCTMSGRGQKPLETATVHPNWNEYLCSYESPGYVTGIRTRKLSECPLRTMQVLTRKSFAIYWACPLRAHHSQQSHWNNLIKSSRLALSTIHFSQPCLTPERAGHWPVSVLQAQPCLGLGGSAWFNKRTTIFTAHHGSAFISGQVTHQLFKPFFMFT